MANYSIQESTKAFLRPLEGKMLVAYWDYSRYSIAYGSGTLLNGSKVQKGDRITEQEAELLLSRDIQEAQNYVNYYVKSDISRAQNDALVSFVYNCGAGNFKGSTLLSTVNSNPNNYEAIRSAFLHPNWITAGRESRRIKEANYYSSGGAVNATNPFFLVAIIIAIIWLIKRRKK